MRNTVQTEMTSLRAFWRLVTIATSITIVTWHLITTWHGHVMHPSLTQIRIVYLNDSALSNDDLSWKKHNGSIPIKKLPSTQAPRLITGSSIRRIVDHERSKSNLDTANSTLAHIKERCKNGLFLLVVVQSAAKHTNLRSTIRDTWGSWITNTTLSTDLLFIVGRTPDLSLAKDLQAESEQFRDVLSLDTVDSYGNLTLKSMAMLKWTTTFCPGLEFLLKSDDDVFINIPLLVQDLRHTVHRYFVMGDVIAGAQPMREQRSKWYTTHAQFRDSVYPKYVSGYAYVLSGDIIQDMYKVALSTPFFWIEDVFITGFCASKVNATYLSNGKFGYRRRPRNPCLLRIFISSHRLKSHEQGLLWRSLHMPSLQCDNMDNRIYSNG